MSEPSKSKISNVQQLYEMLRYVAVPEGLYVITKDGQRIVKCSPFVRQCGIIEIYPKEV